MSPLTSYLLLFSYSIKHIQIYTICRKTDDCTLHIIKKKKKKKKTKNKNPFVNCRHSPPSIVSEIQIQQKLYLKITRLPNTQQIFLYYTCAIPIVFFFNSLIKQPPDLHLQLPLAYLYTSVWAHEIEKKRREGGKDVYTNKKNREEQQSSKDKPANH